MGIFGHLKEIKAPVFGQGKMYLDIAAVVGNRKRLGLSKTEAGRRAGFRFPSQRWHNIEGGHTANPLGPGDMMRIARALDVKLHDLLTPNEPVMVWSAVQKEMENPTIKALAVKEALAHRNVLNPDALKRFRLLAGLSKNHAGRLAGKKNGAAYWQTYESGRVRRPGLDVLEALAKAVGTTVDKIVADESEVPDTYQQGQSPITRDTTRNIPEREIEEAIESGRIRGDAAGYARALREAAPMIDTAYVTGRTDGFEAGRAAALAELSAQVTMHDPYPLEPVEAARIDLEAPAPAPDALGQLINN